MDWILGNAESIVDVMLKLVGAFAIISTMTPNEAANAVADSRLRFINLLGGNFGKSSNT